MKKVIISIIMAAASMMMAGCKGEQVICKNRHYFNAELRHGTYFQIKGGKVLAVRWENSDWRKAEGYTMAGDTITLTDGKGTHLFYNSSKN